MKNFIIAVVVIVILAVGGYFLVKSFSNNTVVTTDTPSNQDAVATTTIEQKTGESVIGKSVEGRNIMAYRYGTGSTELLFVGGIHGGYEWNTALVAYELTNYLKENPSVIPNNIKVTVIPVLNPDGLYKVVGTSTGNFSQSNVSPSQATVIAGRFNANNVDLNRNFDCDWQTSAKWQSKTVSGGSSAFSEPESLSIKNYIETNKPKAVVVWYSSASGVFASNCHNGVSAETNTLTKTYADASGYSAYQSFDFYAITGDMVNWLAKNNIPAISVLLTNHTDTEWTKNKKGVEAVLKYYSQ